MLQHHSNAARFLETVLAMFCFSVSPSCCTTKILRAPQAASANQSNQLPINCRRLLVNAKSRHTHAHAHAHTHTRFTSQPHSVARQFLSVDLLSVPGNRLCRGLTGAP